ncbi:MAG: type III pantothenate kinase [Oscillospiraceae bacterium]|nr:type III pantothenate kinase [Oscillospiraceae bacterium]
MIIAADIRNTYMTIGCIKDGKLQLVFTISTDVNKTQHEYAMTVKSILDFHAVGCSEFSGVIISSVVPRLTPVLREALRMLTGKKALVLGAGVKTGLNILIDNPAQLGSDLVAGAVGALAQYPTPMVIIDFCTATTFSVIDARSNYLGGSIAPGLDISMKALSSSASLLNQITLEAPKNAICTNTEECMKSGVVYGMASMVDGMIDRIEKELGENIKSIVATGAFAGAIVPYCTKQITKDDYLTLKGLAAIYTKNKRVK